MYRNSNKVRRYPVKPDGALSIYGTEIVMEDLPKGGAASNRTMDFGPSGMLYINVGSLCNDSKERDAETGNVAGVSKRIGAEKFMQPIFAMQLVSTGILKTRNFVE